MRLTNNFFGPASASFLVFLSAFLLFLVEPIATKQVLPTLGGAPQVWNTAVVFFQCCLLAGYLAAHFLLKCTAKVQVLLYVLLLAACLAFMPFSMTIPQVSAARHPFTWLLLSLTFSLSLPYLLLAATNTLVQSWLSRQWGSDYNPYPLYAASNAGSLLALLAFFPLEYLFPLPGLRAFWTAGFMVFAALMVPVSLFFSNAAPEQKIKKESSFSENVSTKDCLRWVLLAFVPSALFLSVTTYITTDIASIPLLWVMPLALYLLTFILGFSRHQGGYAAAIRLETLIILLTGIVIALSSLTALPSFVLIVPLLSLFVVALCCHGQLAILKPHPEHLSRFYLWISLGGVLGGMFSALLAPQLFNLPLEYPLLLIAASLLAPRSEKQKAKSIANLFLFLVCSMAVFKVGEYLLNSPAHAASIDGWLKVHFQASTSLTLNRYVMVALAAIIWFASLGGLFYARKVSFALCLCALFLAPVFYHGNSSILYEKRNFFGVSVVYYDSVRDANIFRHGTTIHSIQNRSEGSRLSLAGYYYPAREIYSLLAKAAREKPVAVVGLGGGTLSCLTDQSGQMDLFEIDPQVVEIAQDPHLFTYMRDCPAKKRVILGDARLSLLRESPQRYGFIIMDAFASDAIPVHLLTREAVSMYLSRLDGGGVIAFHISNRYFNLLPLFAALQKSLSLEGYSYFNTDLQTPNELPSLWVCLARSFSAADRQNLTALGWVPLMDSGKSVWTDQYSNILSYLQ